MELAASGAITDKLVVGGNYTWQVRHVRTPGNVAPLQLTGDPMYKAFLYANWMALPGFTITPTLDWASNRWTSNTAGTLYFKTGMFYNFGMAADYHLTGNIDINAGVKNIADDNYQLAAGFPEAGRSYFVELRFAQ
jgi:iron complex outermembrane receptor protein